MSSNDNTSSWKSHAGYIWALMGSAVGFANVLSFSAKAYKNGGGAFMIPYLAALFLLGVPMLILEGRIGNRFQLPLISAFGSALGRRGKIFGWLSVLSCLTIGGFYIVLTGYSAEYTFLAATNSIPEDTKSFFLNDFLQISSGISDFGSISYRILIATALVAIFTYFVLVKKVQEGIEKVCSIFMPVLAVIMTLFAVAIHFLPGGSHGWAHYLTPDFSKILDPALWCDVFGQLFFSLSLGLGIIVGYSRYTKPVANITQAMLCVALGDFFVSFVSGAALFGCIAHMSHVQGVPFESILQTDSTFEIGFILFPTILQVFGSFAPVIGTIFFFCIFIAGITGVFSIVESIAGNLEIEFSLSRQHAVVFTLFALFAISLFFCLGNASYVLDALVPMVLGTNMLIAGLALIIVFVYLQPVFQFEKNSIFLFCIKKIAPLLLGIILINNLIQELGNLNINAFIRCGWFTIALILSLIFAWRSNKSYCQLNMNK